MHSLVNGLVLALAQDNLIVEYFFHTASTALTEFSVGSCMTPCQNSSLNSTLLEMKSDSPQGKKFFDATR